MVTFEVICTKEAAIVARDKDIMILPTMMALVGLAQLVVRATDPMLIIDF
jgi:hypothetical protein